MTEDNSAHMTPAQAIADSQRRLDESRSFGAEMSEVFGKLFVMRVENHWADKARAALRKA